VKNKNMKLKQKAPSTKSATQRAHLLFAHIVGVWELHACDIPHVVVSGDKKIHMCALSA
jgi:hypothetical protein